MTKEWFVILQQREIETMNTGNQLLVYAAIKSYSANGKNEIDLSIREIVNRSKLSIGEVHKIVPQLIELGFLQIVGQKARRGGSVPIYKAFTLRTPKRLQNEHLNNESVHEEALSVHSAGAKDTQSKKVNEDTEDITLKNQEKAQAGNFPLTSEERKKLFHFAESLPRKVSR